MKPLQDIESLSEISKESPDLDIIQIKETQFEKAFGESVDILSSSIITIGGADYLNVDIKNRKQCADAFKAYELQVFKNIAKENEESFDPVPRLLTCKNENGAIVPRSIIFPFGFYMPLKVDNEKWMMCSIHDESASCEYNFYISDNLFVPNRMDAPSPDYENLSIYFNFPELRKL